MPTEITLPDGSVIPIVATVEAGAAAIEGGGAGWSYSAASGGITDATAVEIAPAVAAKKNYLTSLQVSNGGTGATDVEVLDGTTVIWRGWAPASTGGQNFRFPTPLAGSVNTHMQAKLSSATNVAVYVNAQGYTA